MCMEHWMEMSGRVEKKRYIHNTHRHTIELLTTNFCHSLNINEFSFLFFVFSLQFNSIGAVKFQHKHIMDKQKTNSI